MTCYLVTTIPCTTGANGGGGAFIQELLSTPRCYRAPRSESVSYRRRIKKGMEIYESSAHEFNDLYMCLERTVRGRLDAPPCAPFRPRGSGPYKSPTEKVRLQAQFYSDWDRMWGRYQFELRNQNGETFIRSYIEHDYHCGFQQDTSSFDPPLALAAESEMLTVSDIHIPDGTNTVCADRPAQFNSQRDTRYFQNGSASPEWGDSSSLRNRLGAIVSTATSGVKLHIQMRSAAEGAREPYQSSWKMWVQFCRFRRMSHWFRTDAVGCGAPFLDFYDGGINSWACRIRL